MADQQALEVAATVIGALSIVMSAWIFRVTYLTGALRAAVARRDWAEVQRCRTVLRRWKAI